MSHGPGYETARVHGEDIYAFDKLYGWPLAAVERGLSCAAPEKGISVDYLIQRIVIDAAVGIVILLATWFLCEYLIRKRAAQNSP